MSRRRGLCQLACGEPAVIAIASYRICRPHLDRLRAIALDADVAIDEELLGGTLRKFGKRALTRAERQLEDNQERRAIEVARAAP